MEDIGAVAVITVAADTTDAVVETTGAEDTAVDTAVGTTVETVEDTAAETYAVVIAVETAAVPVVDSEAAALEGSTEVVVVDLTAVAEDLTAVAEAMAAVDTGN
jgi:hypothetical protein